MAKVLKILTLPKDNKFLRQKCADVTLGLIKTAEFKRFISDMTRTMEVKDGIGLAAPQIGKSIRVALINTKEGPVCLVNPKIVKKSLAKESAEEGCLSIPNLFGQVKRHKALICDYIDMNGNQARFEAKGLMARAVQHELDHLDGILFIDKVVPRK